MRIGPHRLRTTRTSDHAGMLAVAPDFVCGCQIGVLLVAALAGCQRTTPETIPPSEVSQINSESPVSVPVQTDLLQSVPESEFVVSEYVSSRPSGLQLECTAATSAERSGRVINFSVNLRSSQNSDLTVYRPLSDWNHVVNSALTITGPDGLCRYIGPILDRPRPDTTFVTVSEESGTGGQASIDLSQFSNTETDGWYELSYMYSPDTPHRVEAQRRSLTIWEGTIDAPHIRVYIGQKRPLSEFERHVQIQFDRPRYRFTLDEVAKGVTIEYTINISRDFYGAPQPLDIGHARGADSRGLAPFHRIAGHGQVFHSLDIGLGAEPRYDRLLMPKGHHSYKFEWTGQNWEGPSDTDNPFGSPFPNGVYELSVRIAGMVEIRGVRQSYDIRRAVPIELNDL